MNILLPRRRNGSEVGKLQLDQSEVALIVGANGAGKTRFTAAVAGKLGKKAYPVSALAGLYGQSEKSDELTPERLDSLLARLMKDEMLNLIAYKLALAEHRPTKLATTRLDKVIELWQDIFPGNRVLIDSGRMLFARGIEATAYPALRLSDGEKAVLYYTAAVLYAPQNSVVFVEAPEMFLHPSLTASLWNRLETIRSDCSFIYTTHDTEFASSRNGAPVVWVRDCDSSDETWDYDILPPQTGMTQELYMTLIGARKPVLFIEGDSRRSIDAKLYPLVFPDYNVRSLGSCNKVIEATRTFNDLSTFHKMESHGIVDRDRRDSNEVAYLRRKNIMVPEVAEIENMLLLDDIIAAMAKNSGQSVSRVLQKVHRSVTAMFKADILQQALLHTRHRVKRIMECRVDSKSADIRTFERHLSGLLKEINPREIYESFCQEFQTYADNADYNSILRVYNQKSMLPGCNVAQLCGFSGKEDYIDGILNILRKNTPGADDIRNAVRRCLCGDNYETPLSVNSKLLKKGV